MKAVLLCAGQGSRLRPLTDDRPKGMVEIGGRTILERQLEQLASIGVDEIVVVGGYRHDTIPVDGITKRVNDEFESSNMVASLFRAEVDFADAESLIVSYADIIYSDDVLQAVVESTASFGVAVDLDWYQYFARRSDDVLSDAESLRLTNGRIIDIGRRALTVGEIEGQYIGLMKFDRSAIDAICEIYHSALGDGREIGWGRPIRTAYMTDLLQECVNRGHDVGAVPINGGWCEIDTLEDYQLAETMLASIEG